MNKKVAILGKLSTRYDAPFSDKEYDIWSVNRRPNESPLPRCDKWFDLHFVPFTAGQDFTRDNFPFEEIDNMLGGHYFNNSISYVIAYAVYMGYKEIVLYGMNFSTVAEQNLKQYENVRELIFFAKGKGIKVTAPSDEIMLKQYPEYTQEYVRNR